MGSRRRGIASDTRLTETMKKILMLSVAIVAVSALSAGAADAKATQDAAASDPAERLKKLNQLKDAGLVTDAEFEAKKAEILSDL